MKQFRSMVFVLAGAAALFAGRTALAGESSPSSMRRIGLLDWHTDYVEAYQQARKEQKQLLVFFRDEREARVADNYEQRVLASDFLWIPLSGYVRAVVPTNAQAVLDSNGASKKLIEHPAFEQLRGRQGMVTIDLSNRNVGPYGQVTAAHPFARGMHYSASATGVLLNLPNGTLTQRALIYALRMHPQGPRLTNQGMSSYLASQASHHSSVMAQMEQVGHQNWSSRFQTITAAMNCPVNEVAASGYGDTIVDAAISCVDSWRSSPGHWSLITSNPLFYGYDLVRGRSGQWYATGIMSGR